MAVLLPGTLTGAGDLVTMGSFDTLFLFQGERLISTSGTAITSSAGTKSADLYLDGLVYGNVAVNLASSSAGAVDFRVNIGATGQIIGVNPAIALYAPVADGGYLYVDNAGTITSETSFAVYMDRATEAVIKNSGDIKSTGSGSNNNAIIVTSDSFKLTNSGLISSEISFNSTVSTSFATIYTTATTTDIYNSGEIFGHVAAIHSFNGVEHLTNDGVIRGAINFSDGVGPAADLLENNGSIFGDIILGTGDDVVRNSGLITGAVQMFKGNDLLQNTGTIIGTVGFSGGTFAQLNNDGIINGIILVDDLDPIANQSMRIRNTGDINGDVLINGPITVEVYNDGTINGDLSVDGDNTRVYNTGTILGVTLGDNGSAYFGSSGKATVVVGGDGVDSIFADNGFNQIVGGASGDWIDGGGGVDILYFGASTAGVFVSLKAQRGFGGDAEGDRIYNIEGVSGSTFNDKLVGDAGINELFGNTGKDLLIGGAGNDKLFGGTGKDELRGDDGDDLLVGGQAQDIMFGGAGEDVFSYEDISDSGITGGDRDKIGDFAQGFDVIDLSTIGATSFDGTSFSGAAGSVRYIASAGKTDIQLDVDGDGSADFAIRLTNGEFVMTVEDFVLG